mmetsp:Transcript_67696/g.214275  ORF Transcript_67696/g.214275 Transcript_67696/m.214275 type:complete len:115 (+) Transcript_67696:194-538(+)
MFAGGKLKLKGGGLSVVGGTKKKSKKKDKKEKERERDRERAEAAEGGSSDEDRAPPVVDSRTDAERRRDEKLAAREESEIKKMAGKTHREKVAEFNEYLSKLTEHYDIPKVGPG